MGVALGYLDMPIDEFWIMTPRQLQLKLDAKNLHEEGIQRLEWERMRFQTIALINKDRKRQHQIKAKDLISFAWEKENNEDKLKADRKKAMYLIEKSRKEQQNNKEK